MQQVVLQEESLGDGLISEERLFGLAEKMEIIQLLAMAGVRRMRLGSFAHSRSVPQAANTDVLVALVRRHAPEMRCTALVRNEKGLERALRSGLDHICVEVPVSEADSRMHYGRPVDEVMTGTVRLIGIASTEGALVRAGIDCAFGCALEGPVADAALLETIDRLTGAGANAINLIDTSGMAHPQQVGDLVTRILDRFPQIELSLHLHDTRGLGLVNLYAGYTAGVRVFDVAAGGLGGSPDGSPDNVATEDAVHLLHGLGAVTGIDLNGCCRVVGRFETLLGRTLPGRICRVLRQRTAGDASGDDDCSSAINPCWPD